MSVGLTLVLLSPLVEILVQNHRQFCNTLSIFDIKSLTIFVTKSSIIDLKQGSKYTSEFLDFALTNFFNFCNSRSSHRRRSIKKTFRSTTLFKRDFTQVFSCEYCEMLRAAILRAMFSEWLLFNSSFCYCRWCLFRVPANVQYFSKYRIVFQKLMH